MLNMQPVSAGTERKLIINIPKGEKRVSIPLAEIGLLQLLIDEKIDNETDEKTAEEKGEMLVYLSGGPRQLDSINKTLPLEANQKISEEVAGKTVAVSILGIGGETGVEVEVQV